MGKVARSAGVLASIIERKRWRPRWFPAGGVAISGLLSPDEGARDCEDELSNDHVII